MRAVVSILLDIQVVSPSSWNLEVKISLQPEIIIPAHCSWHFSPATLSLYKVSPLPSLPQFALEIDWRDFEYSVWIIYGIVYKQTLFAFLIKYYFKDLKIREDDLEVFVGVVTVGLQWCVWSRYWEKWVLLHPVCPC